jgi:hypothetical protein
LPGQKNAVKLVTPDGKEYQLNILIDKNENNSVMVKNEKTVEC